MKVLHVITGISRASGGPARSVQGLVSGLNRGGFASGLLALRPGETPWVEGVSPFFNGQPFESVLMQAAPPIVHLHGLWSLDLHRCVSVCRRRKTPYIISPRGMLDPWALGEKRLKKLVAMFLYQRADLKHAAAIHATAEAEAAHIRMQRFEQPIIIAPNGVEVPDLLPERAPCKDGHRALFLSRLHPGKGLLALAHAWARVRPKGWRMKVVGPDSYGHKQEVVECLKSLGVAEDWEFIDALDDKQKWKAYRSADLLVHPSVSENFGITIAEGLAAGLPVIATKGTPWAELAEQKCGWWIDVGVEPLAAALKAAMALTDDERRQMGERGRELVDEKYTWDAVVKTMVKGYESLVVSG